MRKKYLARVSNYCSHGNLVRRRRPRHESNEERDEGGVGVEQVDGRVRVLHDGLEAAEARLRELGVRGRMGVKERREEHLNHPVVDELLAVVVAPFCQRPQCVAHVDLELRRCRGILEQRVESGDDALPDDEVLLLVAADQGGLELAK